jgi:asparagine synthase (glutamine-hydrolysing)
MTRIAATIAGRWLAGASGADGAMSRMLEGMHGRQEIVILRHGAIGASIDGTGGLLQHPRGVLLFDGQLYDGGQHLDSETNRRRELDGIMERILRVGVVQTVAELDGDFALVWIDNDGVLWLARDRFGLHPLYYAELRDGWVVASQPLQLLAHGGVDFAPDPAFLVRYGGMHYRMIDNEPHGSPYRDIKQVPAAHVLRLNPAGACEQFHYWTIEEGPDYQADEAELAGIYRELLYSAVERRVRRFSNRAFTLSGGMDSSSVLAFAARKHGPQVAYSTIYDDPTYDEREDIADMLSLHVSEWRSVAIPSQVDLLREIDDLIAIHNEPVATATWLSHLHLMRQAQADGVTAMFGGLGGDELNAGEYEYFPFHFADLSAEKRDQDLIHEQKAWAHNHNHPVFKKSPEIAANLVRRFTDPTTRGRCLPDTQRLHRYTSTLGPSLQDHVDQRPLMEAPFSSYLKNRTWQDLTRETIPCCTRAEDRHGSTYGIAQVLPFLDRSLVEFCFRVPGSMKIRDGITKRLLREATRNVLPHATRNRVKKTGWNAPAHLWFSGGQLNIVRDLVQSKEFARQGVYRSSEVLRMIDEHESIILANRNAENHMMFLWQVVNVTRWLQWTEDQAKRISGN